MLQMISPQQWEIDLKLYARGWKVSAITGHDEFEVIHDPTLVGKNLDKLKAK